MKKFSTIILLVLSLIFAVGCDAEKDATSIIFDHDKAYKEYRGNHSEMESWQEVKVPIDGSVTLADTEHFSLYLENGDTNRGELRIVHEFKQTEARGFDAPDLCSFIAYDSEGNPVASLSAGTKSGYYNPYIGEWEPCVWTEKNDGKEIVLKMIAIESIFVSEEVLPTVMLEEDYAELMTLAEAKGEANILDNWYLKYDLQKYTMGQIQQLGFDSILDKKTVEKGVYALRNTEARHQGEADNEALDWGFTTEQKRIYEKNVLGNVKAVSAIVTVTINIEGEYPVFSIEHETISPKNTEIAKIDMIFSVETVNKLYAEAYEN